MAAEPLDQPQATAPPLRVLVVDDEPNIRQTLGLCLRQFGCEVGQAAGSAEALAALARDPFDLAFLDLRLGAEDGVQVLPRLLAARPALEVVMITAFSSVDTAVEAMRRGARDYLPKPFTPGQIRHVLDRTRERRALEGRLSRLQAEVAEATPEPVLETGSARMRATLALISRAAAHDVPVLLRGEGGTGKGVLARALHAGSARRDRPLVAVGCPALAEARQPEALFGRAGPGGGEPGLVEAAEGGTLFLDEVGALSLECQGRLLRLLQLRQVERAGEGTPRAADVRLVASTQRDLEAEAAAGRFLRDLLYRLNVVEVAVPPLRDRPEDVLPLARAFTAFFARAAGRPAPRLSRAAEEALAAWSWPGNVRELRNVVERALILAPGDIVEPEVFPERLLERAEGPPRPGGDFTAEEMEREHVMRVLARAPTLADASRILGLDVATLWRKRKKWGR